ncbi:hypothetical protein Pcinc_010415 [Petrolisthes cinctipes]|uniref:Rac GTPase activating protein 1 n=1 Tax=Petrolisthes cinctipes TaxID=88211 RepID=A0AAE1G4Z2_PETCI|nr:hypothetical protein Pcinc_010415 [Petrolisthes cinctipes]
MLGVVVDGEGGKMASVLAQFDGLIRCMQVLNDPAENKFLEFLECEEEHNKQRRSLEQEVLRLQDQLNQSQDQSKKLEMKLKNARHLLDVEKVKRINAETEKSDLAGQIGLVMELLGREHVNETRERLQQLQYSFTSCGAGTDHRRSTRELPLSPGPLATITEDCDSVDTILNVSQMDITEEDDLEESKLRSGRNYKRKSSPDRLEVSGPKRRSGNKSPERGPQVKTQVTYEYCTTGETLRKVQAEVEVKPPRSTRSSELRSEDKRGKRSGSSLLSQPPITSTTSVNLTPTSTPFSPPCIFGTPNTPWQGVGQAYTTPTQTPLSQHTPLSRNYSASKINRRTHAFCSKTIYKSEICQPCGKRIKFGKNALKCRDCRAVCHPECRESVPLPCVPIACTPSAKDHQASIADFVPKNPPMVPAIVVHCANEVERRGLSEIGIYRQCGSEKEVKELKDRFLRGKGVPNLSLIDVHAVSGCIKYFLRSLKEPLITHSLWKDFITAADKSESQDSTASMYQAISELPRPNRDTLAFMIMHLQRIAECPECKMPISNLAKVFGPTLVGYSAIEPDPATLVLETRQQQQVMEKLLEISSDYWNTFLDVPEENLFSPENGGSLLGGMPTTTPRRRSIVTRGPLPPRDPLGTIFRQ